ncbi:ATP-binding protein [Pseudomonadota bacterium]
MKVLIVEDTEDSRVMLERSLAKDGYVVISGVNGVEALRLARENQPDLIISDIMMPEMDGFELCRRIKDEPELSKIPFIFYTATYTERHDEELAMALGANRFVIKPQAPQEFMAIVKQVLKTAQSDEQMFAQGPQKEKHVIKSMYLHSVARKLDKKIKELEREREELGKSEAKYRRLVESLKKNVFIYAHDTDGIFNYVSPSITDVLGYSKEEFCTHYAAYLTDSPINKEVERKTEAAIKGEAQQPYDLEILHKDGKVHRLMISEAPTYNAKGRIDGVEGIAYDITERVHMEKTMVQTEKMLSVGGLAAGMAHEINNPLGAILQGIQNIRRRLSTELQANQEIADDLGLDLHALETYLERREINIMFDMVASSGERASDIILNMLGFSRKSSEAYFSINLADLIGEVQSLAAFDYDLKKKYDFKNIQINHEFLPDLPNLECVPANLQQVLLNIFTNAAHAFQAGGMKPEHMQITVRTSLDKGQAFIEVSDNGPGMTEEVRKRVFEPFFTTKPPGKGTGLGMSVAYNIVCDEHHGRMEVESAPGHGATFKIWLPLKQGD